MTNDLLDAHLDALGGELDRGVARAERRRRRWQAGGALSTVALAVGLGALVALPGGRDLDPVAEARAAIAPRGGLLHYVLEYDFIPPRGSRIVDRNDSAATEIWTATEGPDRYRYRSPSDGHPRYCSVVGVPVPGRGLVRTVVAPMEFAQDGWRSTNYSSFSRAAVVSTVRRRPPAARKTSGLLTTPAFGVTDPRDPVRAIQEALKTGQLRDAGTITQGGRTLRKLVGQSGRTRRVPDEVVVVRQRDGRHWRKRQSKYTLTERPTKYTYLVDADTFAPVELRTSIFGLWSLAGGRPHQKWSTNIQRFSSFEYLPDTPANRRLLTIVLPRGTTIYRQTRLRAFQLTVGSRSLAADPAAQRRCEAARRR